MAVMDEPLVEWNAVAVERIAQRRQPVVVLVDDGNVHGETGESEEVKMETPSRHEPGGQQVKRNVRSEDGAGAGSLQQEPERATTAHHAEQAGFGNSDIVLNFCSREPHTVGWVPMRVDVVCGGGYLATDDQRR